MAIGFRRAGPLLVAGWVIGLLTAAVVPDLPYERQSILLGGGTGNWTRIRDAVERDGWRVARTESVGSEVAVFWLERSRLRLPGS